MTEILSSTEAFGWPGIPPRWTQGGKDGVGTAYSGDSRVWFTVWNGVITEVYYPTIDRPQVRDLQLMITDGATFFQDEKRSLSSSTVRLSDHSLGYEITNRDPENRYSVVKRVIAAPHLPAVLQRVHLEGAKKLLSRLRLYLLCAPHLQVGGWGNHAFVAKMAGRPVLVAEKQGVWLALGATVPFSRCSCGFVGISDGWTDLHDNFEMDWEFECARDGNVALTGELALRGATDFTVALAFGDGVHSAVTTLLQALSLPFGGQLTRYDEQWGRPCEKMLPLEAVTGDGGNLYHSSFSLLLGHEDKTFPGALIASLSIPWGEAKGDEDTGGYHLVWTRDVVQSALGMMAAGNTDTPLRALIYLAASQREDGGFSQNFWIDGTPYFGGIQLDEVAFPILLAWRLDAAGALGDFDPYSMVFRAAAFLIRHGPATQQERWEESSGYSPSTLASNIAALVCAAGFARARADEATARYLEEYADFLESHVERWTVTTAGSLHAEVKRHYIRIRPVDIADPYPDEDPDWGLISIANLPPGAEERFPAREIVDAGFLELVRYGIRRPDDPLVVDSLHVVDSVLRVETPFGPCWRRYNHDGYGQLDDGAPFRGWGRGRAWPLLTGERAHYELALGRDVGDLLRAMEGFASTTGMLPEQVWDSDDIPDVHMYLGRPTGSAMPLMWAHAEYLRLVRSVGDGKVFDSIPLVAERYLEHRERCVSLEVWKPNRRPRTVRGGDTLRIQAGSPFRVQYSLDHWRTLGSVFSSGTALGVEYVDIPIATGQESPVRFTFFWPGEDRWEGRDYEVLIEDGPREEAS